MIEGLEEEGVVSMVMSGEDFRCDIRTLVASQLDVQG